MGDTDRAIAANLVPDPDRADDLKGDIEHVRDYARLFFGTLQMLRFDAGAGAESRVRVTPALLERAARERSGLVNALLVWAGLHYLWAGSVWYWIGSALACLVASLALGRQADARLSRQCADNQSSTHPNEAVNAPVRKFNAALLQRLSPGEHMLIDAVHQRSI